VILRSDPAWVPEQAEDDRHYLPHCWQAPDSVTLRDPHDVAKSPILGLAFIAWVSFRATVRGLLKDQAVAVLYVLTTRSSTRPS
jgi:hypothetical protein